MYCLGIESTAHTFGAGVVTDKGELLADVRRMYKPVKGGIHPRESADFLADNAGTIVEEALQRAGIQKKDLGLVAFSQGPGLPPCLRVGAAAARSLAKNLNVPLVGVNHCVAHIEIGRLLTEAKDPVILYVSGGNTQVIAYAEGRYRVFGETQDVPIGNALDSFAREAGLPHPGGPEVERLARNGKYVELPYVVKGMDMSFSGIVSEAVRKLKAGVPVEDLCFSLQETCYAMLIEVTERAMAHAGKSEVLIAGGVAANRRFVEMLETMCKERGAKAFSVPMEYAGDNGTMIGWAGVLAHKHKAYPEHSKIMQKWRTDEVDVRWI